MLARVRAPSRPRPRRRILARVLARRCPQCGLGALFRRYARLAPGCARCGLVYRREPGAQTGTMYLTAAASEVFAAALAFLLWWAFDWTPLAFVLVSAPLVLAFCAFLLPAAQALWVGIEYATDLESREPWAELRE
jgi:uncharacterized protein (DUF983 family)